MNASRINLLPTGNRPLTSKKPATESTAVQGIPFIKELYFLDQNCKPQGFHLSGRNARLPPVYEPVLVPDGGKYHTREV